MSPFRLGTTALVGRNFLGNSWVKSEWSLVGAGRSRSTRAGPPRHSRHRVLATIEARAAVPANYFGRLIPRALMREASVVGLISSSSAAPPGPYTFQRAWSRAASTFSRSRPLISASRATAAVGRDCRMAACLGLADGGPEWRRARAGSSRSRPTPLGKNDGPLNHVLELPDIPGPVVLPEGRNILACQSYFRALETGTGQSQEMRGEGADVLRPFPQ